MFANIFGSARVVKENGKVEGVRVFNINQDLAVPRHRRVIGLNKSVELVDTLQRVLIRGIAVKKFVLYETLECTEFREITSKNSASVH